MMGSIKHDRAFQIDRHLDEDGEFRQEVQNAARALGNAVRLARAGRLE